MTDESRAGSPAHPGQLRGDTWIYLLRRTVREFIRDGCPDAAAALTFFAVLSIFPAALALIAVVGLVGDSEDAVTRLLDLIDQVAPAAVAETLRAPLLDISGATGAGLTLVISIATALWSASLYVGAFGRLVNRVYEVEEGRPYWKRKPAQIVVTIALLVLALIVIAVITLSAAIARALGDAWNLGDAAIDTWNVVRWPVLALAAVIMVTLLFTTTSNVRHSRLRWVAPGALLTLALIGASSALFTLYVSTIGDYGRTFGALGGIVVFLIWLFLLNLALLMGVEFIAELERGRQLQAGIAAEGRVERTLRDDTAIERLQEETRITVDRGAQIRRGEDLGPRPDGLVRRARTAVTAWWQSLRASSPDR